MNGGFFWRLFGYVLASGVSAIAVAAISQERLVGYDSRASVVIFALLLGTINATIRPVLRLLTLPLTCLTFGAFALVLNAGLFGLAALLTPGMRVTGWGMAIGAIIASVTAGVIFSLVDER